MVAEHVVKNGCIVMTLVNGRFLNHKWTFLFFQFAYIKNTKYRYPAKLKFSLLVVFENPTPGVTK